MDRLFGRRYIGYECGSGQSVSVIKATDNCSLFQVLQQSFRDYSSIMILGERNFMCLTDNGKVEFILKLDYAPKCFHSFVVGYYWGKCGVLIKKKNNKNVLLIQ